MRFKKITVYCPSPVSDDVSYIIHEAASMGEVFDDYSVVKDVLDNKTWDYADESLFTPTGDCSVSGFFTFETDEKLVIDKILDECNTCLGVDLRASCDVIDSEEWENEWKKYYKPFSIGKIVIVPEWIDYKPVFGEIAVKINPGLAFGTGTHETTSMCIDLMQKINITGKKVLDFGCGSGILGICAQALGARDILFADTDEQAVTATRYNCKINGIENPTVTQSDVRSMNEQADVVLANITADILIDTEPVIRSALKKGGYVILSGIIASRLDSVENKYGEHFTLVERSTKNEWSALIYRS